MVIAVQVKQAPFAIDEVKNANEKSKHNEPEAPPDRYHIAPLLFFFTGLAGMLPVSFFLVANDYWMYKLRDTQYDTYDLKNKTYLQKMFVSVSSISQGFPSLIASFLSAKYAYKITVRKRFLVTLGAISFLFVIFTLFVKINTDSWQTLFFAASITVIAVITIFHPLYSVTNMAFMSRFPSKYLRFNMYGSSISAMFSAVLQIISLSISDSPTDVALIYFISGTLVIMFTFFLCCIMNYSPVINFYWKEESRIKNDVSSHSLKEFYEAARRIWPMIVALVITTAAAGLGHANITNLVVSEGYVDNKTSIWYSKYFVPTVTYLGADVFNLAGRFFGRGIHTKKAALWIILAAAMRSFIIGPLFLFCNAQPRSHLPVWFPHDYQYIIILGVYVFSGSVLAVTQVLSLPKLAGNKTELAFITTQVIGTTTGTLAAFLNPVFVSLL
ncbi:equilibrative nucleoside transporter 3-like [Diorhabda carinulata]|uniref:equilibrative nucleoside transporter 3-like n=1 Tax=Diorhabda carinulata TaxID=1163345 RepID=UPI0025A13950|nr:equilibrative nucleoside transporter 3-like [Diorhabda carinulata]